MKKNEQRLKIGFNNSLAEHLKREAQHFVWRATAVQEAFALVHIIPTPDELRACAISDNSIENVVRAHDWSENGKPTTARMQRISEEDIQESLRIIKRNINQRNYATEQGARYCKYEGNGFVIDEAKIQGFCTYYIEGADIEAYEEHKRIAEALNKFFKGTLQHERELANYFQIIDGNIQASLEVVFMNYPPITSSRVNHLKACIRNVSKSS